MNPFSDILQQHDEESKATLQRVGSLIKDLGIDTTLSPPHSDISSSYQLNQQFFPEFDDHTQEVEELVSKLKALIGEFDTSAIDTKLSESKASHNLSSYSYGLSPEPQEATPMPGVHDNIMHRFSMRSPMPIPQMRPFTRTETPRTVSSQGRRESIRASQALKSTRYSMGLNIFLQPKQLPDSPPMFPSPQKVFTPTLPSFSPTATTSSALFTQFCVIEIDSDLLLCKKALERSNTQTSKISYAFPDPLPPIVENLQEYCFPHGARLELMRVKEWREMVKEKGAGGRGGVRGRIGRGGEEGKEDLNNVAEEESYLSKFQIMQFTDASNKIYYACCLILTLPLSAHNPSLLSQLRKIREEGHASNTIKRYIRHYIWKKRFHIRTHITSQWEENISKSRGNSLEGVGRSNSIGGRSSGGKGSSGGLKSFLTGFMKKKKTNPLGRIKNAFFHKKRAYSSDSSTFDEGGGKDGADRPPAPKHPPPMSPKTCLLAPDTPPARSRANSERGQTAPPGKSPRGSFFSLSSSDSEGDKGKVMRRGKEIVVGQKALCFLSEKPLPALFFQILKIIASKEHKKGLNSSLHKSSRSASHRSLPSAFSPTLPFSAPLSPAFSLPNFLQSLVSHPSRGEGKGGLAISIPSFPSLFFPPSPVSLSEWSVAVLLHFLPPNVISHTILALLLEKSLILLGSDAPLVSILCTAFLHLLKPFHWAGIFVPLLPPLAQELLDAPVPFIVGMCCPELFGREATHRPKNAVSNLANVLYIDDFVRYGKLYKPMPMDMQDIRTSITEVEHLLEQAEFFNAPSLRHFEPCSDHHLSTIIDSIGKELITNLTYQSKRFLIRMGKIYSKYSLLTDYMQVNHLIQELLFDTDEELYRPVRKVLKIVQKFNEEFTAGLLEESFAWQDVGNISKASGFLEIEVDRIIQPMKIKTMFQEQFVCTQMFTSFADRCHSQYEDNMPQRYRLSAFFFTSLIEKMFMNTVFRLFIADWLKYRLWLRRKYKRRLQSRSCML